MLTTMLLACHVDVVGKKSLHTSVPIRHLLSFDYVLARHLVANSFFGPDAKLTCQALHYRIYSLYHFSINIVPNYVNSLNKN